MNKKQFIYISGISMLISWITTSLMFSPFVEKETFQCFVITGEIMLFSFAIVTISFGVSKLYERLGKEEVKIPKNSNEQKVKNNKKGKVVSAERLSPEDEASFRYVFEEEQKS